MLKVHRKKSGKKYNKMLTVVNSGQWDSCDFPFAAFFFFVSFSIMNMHYFYNETKNTLKQSLQKSLFQRALSLIYRSILPKLT